MNNPREKAVSNKKENLSPTRQNLRPESVYFDKIQDELRIIEECKQSLDELIKASKWLNSHHYSNSQPQTLFQSKKSIDIPKNYTKIVSFDIENVKNQSDKDYYDNASIYSLNSNDYLFKDDDIIEFNSNNNTSTNNLNTFKSSFELKLKSTFENSNKNEINNNNNNKNDTKIENAKQSVKVVKRSLVQPSQTRPLLCNSILNKNNENRPKSTDSFLSENYSTILKLQKGSDKTCSTSTLKIDSLESRLTPANLDSKIFEPTSNSSSIYYLSRLPSPQPPIKTFNRIPNSDSMSSFKTSISQQSNCSSSTINNDKTQYNKYTKKNSAEKSPKRHRNHSWIASSLRKAFGFKRDDSKTPIYRRDKSEEVDQMRHSKSSSLRRESPLSDVDELRKKQNRLSGQFVKRNYRSESELLDDGTNRLRTNKRDSYDLHLHKSLNDTLPPRCDKIQRGCSVANVNRINLNDILVSELRAKLSEVENKLTDIRLEALSSVNHVDQLKEFIDKMSIEILSLKCENQMLKSHLNESKQKQMQFDSLKELSEIYDDSMEDMVSNRKFEVFVKSLSKINENVFNYHTTFDFLLNDDVGSNTHKALVTIKSNFNNCSIESIDEIINESNTCLHAICWINVDCKLRWKLMDGIVKYIFKRFISLIDPMSQLGLSIDSIDFYNIGEVKRYLNDKTYPNLLPFGYLVGEKCTIEIVLKDDENKFDLMSFDTLIPKEKLEQYISIVNENRYLAISGSKKFVQSIYLKPLRHNNEVEIIYYDMSKLASLSNDDRHVKSILITNLKEKIACFSCDSHRKKPIIILIDNLHELFINCQASIDILQSLINLKSIENLYFIATFLESTKLFSIDEFLIQIDFNKNFKRIILSPLNEPLKTILEKYLFKILIDYRTRNKTKDSSVLMERIIVWIIEAFRIVNDFIEKHKLYNCYISPFIFIDLPLNIVEAEKWFIKIWNFTIIPHLDDITKTNILSSVVDPTDEIVKKYPWPNPSNKQQLLKLYSYKNLDFDNNFDLSLNRNLQKSNQRLVKMLSKLQKTTRISNRNEISSGFFESMSPSNVSESSDDSLPSIFSSNIKQTAESSL